VTFTYGEDLTVNRDFVRFWSGDTVSAESFLTDEIITSLLAVSASKEAAAVSAIQYIIRRLSQPNFSADWLTVDMKSAREGYEKLLADVRRQLGVASLTATTGYTWRPDSGMTEAPTFDEDDE